MSISLRLFELVCLVTNTPGLVECTEFNQLTGPSGIVASVVGTVSLSFYLCLSMPTCAYPSHPEQDRGPRVHPLHSTLSRGGGGPDSTPSRPPDRVTRVIVVQEVGEGKGVSTLSSMAARPDRDHHPHHPPPGKCCTCITCSALACC